MNHEHPNTALERTNRWMPFEGGVALDSNEDPKPWKVLHNQYTLCIIRHGAADWSYRGRNFRVAPGSIYVCEPGEVHKTTHVYCPGDFTALFLDDRTLPDVADQFGLGGSLHFAPEGILQPDLWRLFSGFRDVLAGADVEARAQVLSKLMTRLVCHSSGPAATRGPVGLRTGLAEAVLQRARQHLIEAFRSDPLRTVRLRPIATELGVPYHSLIREFSKRFRLAPYEYIDALRARRAFLLIRRGPTEACDSLTAVALSSGYTDGPHMSRVFRRHWGLAPSAVARQLNPKWFAPNKKR